MEKGNKLVVSVSNTGDWSVGIPGLDMSITFQGNMDFLDAIKHNRPEFRKDIETLVQNYFDDMPSVAYLEDECPDCGQIMNKLKKGGYKHSAIQRKACIAML